MALFIAVTGGIGSGKSSVAARLAGHGAVIADSDRLAREVVSPGTTGLLQIRERFGATVIAPDGSLDRSALATVVFADRDAREALERIIHPRVRAAVARIRRDASRTTVVVNDIPLLVDLAQVAEYHLVIGVGADEQLRLERLMGRGLAEADARARMSVQIADDRRRFLADAWLENNGTRDALDHEVDCLWFDRILVMHRNLLDGVPASAAVVVDQAERAAAIARTTARVARAIDPGGRHIRPVVGGDDRIRLTVALPGPVGELGLATSLAGAGLMPAGTGDDRSLTAEFANSDPMNSVVVTVQSTGN